METQQVAITVDGKRREFKPVRNIALDALRLQLKNKFGGSDHPGEGLRKVEIGRNAKPAPVSSGDVPLVDAATPLYVRADAEDVFEMVQAVLVDESVVGF